MNIAKRIHERLKWWIADDEMQSLQRYKSACHLVFRWNGNVKNSAETAEWIDEVGNGKRGMDIHEFREKLKESL
jgi:hypothetical protein